MAEHDDATDAYRELYRAEGAWRPSETGPGVCLPPSGRIAENDFWDKCASKTPVGDCENVPIFILGVRVARARRSTRL